MERKTKTKNTDFCGNHAMISTTRQIKHVLVRNIYDILLKLF